MARRFGGFHPERAEMSSSRGRLAAVTILVAALLAGLLQAAPASASTDTPTIMSPASGENVSSNEQLVWERVPGIERYRVQISTGPSFSSLLVNELTFNSTYTPVTELPTGEIHWRVAAVTGTTTGPFASSMFTKDPAAGPPLDSPAHGDRLVFPEQPPVFRWEPLAGARSYVLEIDDANDFVGATRHITRTTSFTPVDPITPGQPHFWRVRGSSATNGSGVLTDWSEHRSFQMVWDKQPELQSLELPDGSTSPGNVVTDVRLEWSEVVGAQYYDLEISKSAVFAGTPDLKVENARGTRYEVSPTLPNGSYYWRVRAKDSRGNLGPWSDTGEFVREWTSRIGLVAPVNHANPATPVSTDIVRFEWEPVDHASHYELQVGTDANFSPRTFDSCFTTQTRFSPYARISGVDTTPDGCTVGMVPAGSVRYWRVRGIDRDTHNKAVDIVGLWSAVGAINYNPAPPVPDRAFDDPRGVEQVAPADCAAFGCALTSTPTLRWKPVADATSYMVYLAVDPNFTSVTRIYSTTQTQLTPREELADNNTGQAYYWHVRPCRTTSSCGPDPTSSTTTPKQAFLKHSVKVALESPGVGPVPHPELPAVSNQPIFRWRPYLESQQAVGDDNGVRSYRIQVSTVSTFATTIENRVVQQEQFTPWASTYPEGPLYWRVRGVDGSGNELAWSDTFVFLKRSPTPVPLLPTGVVTGTPNFSWEPLEHATGYDLEVYRNGDANYSPANRFILVSTAHSSYSPPTQSFAPGDYTWRLRRKDADNRPGDWTAAGLFTVVGADVHLHEPSIGAALGSDDVVFTWQGMEGAASYRFQRSPSPEFSPVTEQRDTVMTSWAPTARIADGTWYWRVLPLDPSGTVIGTSEPEVRVVHKDATPPTVTARTPTRDLPLQGPFTATFSEPVKNVTATSFRVLVAGTSTVVPGRVTQPTPTTARWVPRTPLVPGQSYTAQLRAGITDLSGLRIAPTNWTVRTALAVQNDSPAVVQSWDRDTAAGASGGSFAEARQRGASLTFAFTGTDVQILGRRAPSGGTADVFLDGRKQATVDFYATGLRNSQIVFSRNGLAPGKHTVEVRVNGRKPAGSKGKWVRVEAFRSGGSTYQETAAEVTHRWARVADSSASGGTFDVIDHTPTDNGPPPSQVVEFRGTGVEWIAPKGPRSGRAAVLIDGRQVATVDLYSSSVRHRQRVFSTRTLTNAPHRIEIRPLGTRHASSTGTEVGVDLFNVL
jgi:hypothetical protein